MVFLKIVFLFVAVWFTIINTTRVMYKQDLPAGNVLIQAIEIVGFMVLQFDLIH